MCREAGSLGRHRAVGRVVSMSWSCCVKEILALPTLWACERRLCFVHTSQGHGGRVLTLSTASENSHRYRLRKSCGYLDMCLISCTRVPNSSWSPTFSWLKSGFRLLPSCLIRPHSVIHLTALRRPLSLSSSLGNGGHAVHAAVLLSHLSVTGRFALIRCAEGCFAVITQRNSLKKSLPDALSNCICLYTRLFVVALSLRFTPISDHGNISCSLAKILEVHSLQESLEKVAVWSATTRWKASCSSKS